MLGHTPHSGLAPPSLPSLLRGESLNPVASWEMEAGSDHAVHAEDRVSRRCGSDSGPLLP